jgi:hypothetical protein
VYKAQLCSTPQYASTKCMVLLRTIILSEFGTVRHAVLYYLNLKSVRSTSNEQMSYQEFLYPNRSLLRAVYQWFVTKLQNTTGHFRNVIYNLSIIKPFYRATVPAQQPWKKKRGNTCRYNIAFKGLLAFTSWFAHLFCIVLILIILRNSTEEYCSI